MNEEWRRIPGHPDYEVSDLGRVRSWKAIGRGGPPPRYLAGGTSRGYRHVLLRTNGERTTGFIHRLVAAAFIGPRPPKAEVRHLDGDSLNNRLSNLAYGTHSQNGADLHRHGTHSRRLITHCPKGHPYDGANTYWRKRPTGGRSCRRCRADTEIAARAAGKRPSDAPRPRLPKSHCKRGHPLDGVNLYVRPSGARECRSCQREAMRRWKAKQGAHATTAT